MRVPHCPLHLQWQQRGLGAHTSRLQDYQHRSERTGKFRADRPGNSVREVGDRMNGGAVREERSPENDAILKSARSQRPMGRLRKTEKRTISRKWSRSCVGRQVRPVAAMSGKTTAGNKQKTDIASGF
jgi:hypothetical protein